MQPIQLVKLTDQQNQTWNQTLWLINQPHTLPPTPNPKLCSNQVLHAYRSLNLALLLNPIHANIAEPKAFEATTTEVVVEDATKVGTFDLTLTNHLPLPDWYVNETSRVKVQLQFVILAAEAVLHMFEARFPSDTRPRAAIEAAKEVLANPNITAARAAYAAAHAAAAAADAAYAAADADTAARAAYAAARAAYAAARADSAYAARAARAARAADAAYAARAAYAAAADSAAYAAARAYAAYAARAAHAADSAADSAADAAAADSAAHPNLNLNALADQAVTLQTS